jgi:hypothetical protein
MLLNLGLEVGIGSIPVAGDLFDVGFKGNLRNLHLLEGWLERPATVHRRSRWLLVAVAASVVALLLSIVMLALWLLQLLLTRGR